MDWKNKEKQRLLQAFLALKTTDEARRFLRDLMTEKEIEEFARRLKAATMLKDQQPYISIERDTGLSSTTVARVSRWLQGKEGGYRIILKRLHHHNSDPARRELS